MRVFVEVLTPSSGDWRRTTTSCGPFFNEQEACAKSLKQLEDALADAPSTDKETEEVAKERKAESSKRAMSRASSTEEEHGEEESEEEEDTEEEDELVGSSGVSSKAKGKGRVK